MRKNNNSDSLGARMKGYEVTTQNSLLKRTPVIVRLDGKAFHSFVPRHFNKATDPSLLSSPFSEKLHQIMMHTAVDLFNNVQTCMLVYTQSDEISLLLKDWTRLESQQWFDGNVQKIASVTASIATASFNFNSHFVYQTQAPEYFGDLALFDSRVFNVPKEEVANYFIWRQQDATRNSVQQLGRFYFSQKEMHGKNNDEVQHMLFMLKKIIWDDLPTWAKRGACVAKDEKLWWTTPSHLAVLQDENIPIFTENRYYIERHLDKE